MEAGVTGVQHDQIRKFRESRSKADLSYVSKEDASSGGWTTEPEAWRGGQKEMARAAGLGYLADS